ncbi:MAG: hypothetical protein Q9181_005692 [Wetmoreana brouardii]
MSEKRKPTTRYQGERPPKRRQLTPPPPPAPTPKNTTRREPVNVLKEELPVKSKESQSLPTQIEKQNSNLLTTEYQTIAESGILAASIQQSRQRWTIDGIFERYWTKPSKKKGSAEGSNPAKETMAKIGTCSMIIEPHVFETTLYTVREPPSVFASSQIPPPPPPLPSNSAYNPYQDHRTYQPQAHTSYSHGTYPQYHSQYPSKPSNLTLPPFREGFGQISPQGQSTYRNIIPPRPVERSHSRDNGPPPNLQQDSTASDSDRPPTDPVIQMLATRAASDHNLKALMKVVASGHASQGQLEEFQKHINELNDLIKSQESTAQPAPEHPPSAQPPPRPQSAKTYTPGATTPPLPQPSVQISATPYGNPQLTPYLIKTESHPQTQYFSHIAQPLKTKPALTTSYKPDVVSMVFDFGPHGDRFLFPRFSILEFLPGGTQVIASFLVIRKGSEAASAGEYNRTTTYYQPVTIRLSAPFARMLEPLARVVASPDEVKKYMNGVFDKMSPAKSAFLVTRLPRAKEDGDVEMKEAPSQPIGTLIKRVYSPPNALVPLAG